MRAAQRRQISLVFGWSSMFGSSAFASAGTEQGISYAALRLEPLRWWGIGLAFGGSDVSAASAQVDDQPRQRPHWRELAGKPHRIPALGAQGCRLRVFPNKHAWQPVRGAFPPTPLDRPIL